MTVNIVKNRHCFGSVASWTIWLKWSNTFGLSFTISIIMYIKQLFLMNCCLIGKLFPRLFCMNRCLFKFFPWSFLWNWPSEKCEADWPNAVRDRVKRCLQNSCVVQYVCILGRDGSLLRRIHRYFLYKYFIIFPSCGKLISGRGAGTISNQWTPTASRGGGETIFIQCVPTVTATWGRGGWEQ